MVNSQSADAPVWSIVGPAALNSAVLVLNRHYQPIHVTNAKRAFSLLYLGVARALDREFRTFDFESWSALSAEVGDDVWGEDPTANALQEQCAGLFGKEAGLFVPSGSMGNEAAIKALTNPGEEIIVAMVRVSTNRAPGPLGRAVGKGLAPISVGLVFATGWILFRGGRGDWTAAAVALLAAFVVLRTKINPVWMIAVGAAAGVMGLV